MSAEPRRNWKGPPANGFGGRARKGEAGLTQLRCILKRLASAGLHSLLSAAGFWHLSPGGRPSQGTQIHERQS